MDPGKILEELFDRKTLQILRHLSANPDKQYYLREIAKATRVPIATVFRIINRLALLEIVQVQKIKRMKLYQYGQGKESKFVEGIIEVRRGALEEFVELCLPIPGIHEVVLQGKPTKDRASILLIGEGIPAGTVQEAINGVRETFGFSIIHLTLTPEQYAQMTAMGLYPGERKVLLEKASPVAPDGAQ